MTTTELDLNDLVPDDEMRMAVRSDLIVLGRAYLLLDEAGAVKERIDPLRVVALNRAESEEVSKRTLYLHVAEERNE